MEQAQMLVDLWRMFLRRFWILTIIGTLGIVAVGFLAYVLPPVYEAEAKILVESQQIPDELARSTVRSSAAERLQLIEQQLMTRDNLLRLIDGRGLYRDRPDLSASDKIERIRDATAIEPIAVGNKRSRRQDAEIAAFTIKVSFEDPIKAANIANDFVTMVLDQNLRSRSQRASDTLSFFVNEEKRLAGELASIEADIIAYKKEHEQALPDSLEFRRDQFTRNVESDRATDQRLLELEEKRGALQAALVQAKAAGPALLTPEQKQLHDLEAQLAQKRAVYAEGHREIRALKAQIASMKANLPAQEAISDGTDGQHPELDSILNQIKTIDAQVAMLNDYKVQLKKSRGELETSIQQTPNVEMKLNALSRRHAELQAQYAEVLSKRTDAEIGEKLEVNQQAERFEVIENAIVPDEPTSPNRKKVVVLGSMMSLALAVGIAVLIEMLRPAIRSAAQMQQQLQLYPVVAIPYITTRSERRWRTTRIAVFLALILIGIPAALWAIQMYYLPLELIGARIAEKSGLDEVLRVLQLRL